MTTSFTPSYADEALRHGGVFEKFTEVSKLDQVD